MQVEAQLRGRTLSAAAAAVRTDMEIKWWRIGMETHSRRRRMGGLLGIVPLQAPSQHRLHTPSSVPAASATARVGPWSDICIQFLALSR